MGNIWSTNSNRRRESAYYQTPLSHPHFFPADTIPQPPQAPADPQSNYYHYPPQPPPAPPPLLPQPPYNYYHYNTMVNRYNYPQQPYMYPPQGNGGWFPIFRPNFSPHPQPYLEPAPYVEHQEAKTVKNDVNVHKDTLKLELDESNPGSYLVSFVFDAKVSGSITIIFFAKEETNSQFAPLFPETCPPQRYPFEKGSGQEFRSNTGIDLGFFELEDLSSPSPEEDVFPLVVIAESHHYNASGNMQITQGVLEKKGADSALQVKVIRQIVWVNGERYEVREIYGIAKSSTEGFADDLGKECVICLTEPKDTAILPCRHMCLCSDCAKALRMQSDKCPICRQPIEKLIEIKISEDAQ